LIRLLYEIKLNFPIIYMNMGLMSIEKAEFF
jgi:hypothetical protein